MLKGLTTSDLRRKFLPKVSKTSSRASEMSKHNWKCREIFIRRRVNECFIQKCPEASNFLLNLEEPLLSRLALPFLGVPSHKVNYYRSLSSSECSRCRCHLRKDCRWSEIQFWTPFDFKRATRLRRIEKIENFYHSHLLPRWKVNFCHRSCWYLVSASKDLGKENQLFIYCLNWFYPQKTLLDWNWKLSLRDKILIGWGIY